MTRKVLMVGQFPPLITGESTANSTVMTILEKKGFSVNFVNSCIADSVNDVGLVSIKKSLSALAVIFKSIKKVARAEIVYITPGQTLPGLVRSLPLVLVSRGLKKRIIIHWHGYGILKIAHKYPGLISAFFSDKNHNILLTNDLKEKLKQLHVNITNTSVINNFVKLCGLPSSSSDGSEQQRLKVIYLGGLMPEKGFLHFLEASTKTSDFEFIVCGSGDEKLTKLTRQHEKNGSIKYLGQVKGETKAIVLSKSDIFVLPTFYSTEGVPLTILEAMASGCAIITTAHNGIPETVEDAAIFIEKKNTADLLDKLSQLNSNRSLLASLKAKSLVRAKAFSEKSFEENISTLFSNPVKKVLL